MPQGDSYQQSQQLTGCRPHSHWDSQHASIYLSLGVEIMAVCGCEMTVAWFLGHTHTFMFYHLCVIFKGLLGLFQASFKGPGMCLHSSPTACGAYIWQ